MTYGVKAIRTISVGSHDRLFYEEIILSISAESFDEADKKATLYLQDYFSEYINPDGKIVRTENIEITDCFLAYEPEGDAQELYSAFTTNRTASSENEFYQNLVTPCDAEELSPLRNQAFQ
ncbi:MAG: DUF4288 domain-containing protein [Clostridia bacterium]|nr:DUF4288 domain-containing protein [Clostridia bacterium]